MPHPRGWRLRRQVGRSNATNWVLTSHINDVHSPHPHSQSTLIHLTKSLRDLSTCDYFRICVLCSASCCQVADCAASALPLAHKRSRRGFTDAPRARWRP